MSKFFALLFLSITAFSSIASAELLFLNCVHANHHGYTDSVFLTLDSDRKLLGFAYQGYGGPIAFLENSSGQFGQYSSVKIQRMSGGILSISAQIKAGNNLSPRFLGWAELTLEKLPKPPNALPWHPDEYIWRAGTVAHGNSNTGYPVLKDFKGQVCTVIPTAKSVP